ncbi:hypothetical protein Q9233_006296 [Columba guinea]|nr:hypothetical protein Q9233_006296 [Columba guinea]
MYVMKFDYFFFNCSHFDLPSEHAFNQPAEIAKNMKQTCTSDQHAFYPEVTKEEKSTSATSASHKMANLRCLEIVLTPVKKDRLHTEIATFRSKKDSFQTFKKTQDANLKRQRVKEMCNQECQRLKENCVYSLDKGEKNTYLWNNEMCSLDMKTRTLKKRRTRKDFTTEEINYLCSGVKKMGNHWNLILWSYPFQKGRTNVDLAKKYYRLQLQVILILFSTNHICGQLGFQLLPLN